MAGEPGARLVWGVAATPGSAGAAHTLTYLRACTCARGRVFPFQRELGAPGLCCQGALSPLTALSFCKRHLRALSSGEGAAFIRQPVQMGTELGPWKGASRKDFWGWAPSSLEAVHVVPDPPELGGLR